MQRFSRPLALVYSFPSKPDIPKGPKDQNMKKYQHYIDAQVEVWPTPHRNNNNVMKK